MHKGMCQAVPAAGTRGHWIEYQARHTMCVVDEEEAGMRSRTHRLELGAVPSVAEPRPLVALPVNIIVASRPVGQTAVQGGQRQQHKQQCSVHAWVPCNISRGHPRESEDTGLARRRRRTGRQRFPTPLKLLHSSTP